jgi:hypothetical protein
MKTQAVVDRVSFQNAHAMDEDSGAGPDAHIAVGNRPTITFLPCTLSDEDMHRILADIQSHRKNLQQIIDRIVGRLPDGY